MIHVGIDYSMTSPSVCVYNPLEQRGFSFSNVKIYFLTNRRKFLGKLFLKNLQGTLNPEPSEFLCSFLRYEFISSWVLDILHANECQPDNTKIVIEDYSLGSKGKVFHIAENTGVLKYRLFLSKYLFTPVPPTVLKKFATGKGNSNKDAMYDAFVKKENGPDLLGPFSEKRVVSPVSDIVDSYFFCKYSVFAGV